MEEAALSGARVHWSRRASLCSVRLGGASERYEQLIDGCLEIQAP